MQKSWMGLAVSCFLALGWSSSSKALVCSEQLYWSAGSLDTRVEHYYVVSVPDDQPTRVKVEALFPELNAREVQYCIQCKGHETSLGLASSLHHQQLAFLSHQPGPSFQVHLRVGWYQSSEDGPMGNFPLLVDTPLSHHIHPGFNPEADSQNQILLSWSPLNARFLVGYPTGSRPREGVSQGGAPIASPEKYVLELVDLSREPSPVIDLSEVIVLSSPPKAIVWRDDSEGFAVVHSSNDGDDISYYSILERELQPFNPPNSELDTIDQAVQVHPRKLPSPPAETP